MRSYPRPRDASAFLPGHRALHSLAIVASWLDSKLKSILLHVECVILDVTGNDAKAHMLVCRRRQVP